MGNEKTSSSPRTKAEEESIPVYEIRVKGCIDRELWSGWFEGLEIIPDPGPDETVLRGPIADQAELYGLLARLRDRGLTLVSVQQVRPEK